MGGSLLIAPTTTLVARWEAILWAPLPGSLAVRASSSLTLLWQLERCHAFAYSVFHDIVGHGDVFSIDHFCGGSHYLHPPAPLTLLCFLRRLRTRA